MTDGDWHSVQVSTESLKALGEKVRAERIRQRYSVKAAAEAARMARDTWKRVEAGQGVHDTSRSAALTLLGLNWYGDPVQDADDDPDWARLLVARNRELEQENAELKRRRDETA